MRALRMMSYSALCHTHSGHRPRTLEGVEQKIEQNTHQERARVRPPPIALMQLSVTERVLLLRRCHLRPS